MYEELRSSLLEHQVAELKNEVKRLERELNKVQAEKDLKFLVAQKFIQTNEMDECDWEELDRFEHTGLVLALIDRDRDIAIDAFLAGYGCEVILGGEEEVKKAAYEYSEENCKRLGAQIQLGES